MLLAKKGALIFLLATTHLISAPVAGGLCWEEDEILQQTFTTMSVLMALGEAGCTAPKTGILYRNFTIRSSGYVPTFPNVPIFPDDVPVQFVSDGDIRAGEYVTLLGLGLGSITVPADESMSLFFSFEAVSLGVFGYLVGWEIGPPRAVTFTTRINGVEVPSPQPFYRPYSAASPTRMEIEVDISGPASTRPASFALQHETPPIPEPHTVLLLPSGLLALWWRIRTLKKIR
jgi:hypothetical protein